MTLKSLGRIFVKKLLGVLIVSMFVLVSCAHKEGCKTAKADACSKEAHACTAACDHSADKAMAKDHQCSAESMATWQTAHMEKMGANHVCTDECKVAHMAKHQSAHKCSAECKAAHMEKMGADHVCTDVCKAECKMKHAKSEQPGEAVKEDGEDKL